MHLLVCSSPCLCLSSRADHNSNNFFAFKIVSCIYTSPSNILLIFIFSSYPIAWFSVICFIFFTKNYNLKCTQVVIWYAPVIHSFQSHIIFYYISKWQYISSMNKVPSLNKQTQTSTICVWVFVNSHSWQPLELSEFSNFATLVFWLLMKLGIISFLFNWLLVVHFSWNSRLDILLIFLLPCHLTCWLQTCVSASPESVLKIQDLIRHPRASFH